MKDFERRLRVIESAMYRHRNTGPTAEQAAAGAEWFNRQIDRLMEQVKPAAGDGDASSQSEAERLAQALVWGQDEAAKMIVAQWKQRASG